LGTEISVKEMALGEHVQQTKAALLALLTEEERKSKKPTQANGRVHMWTFEDTARLIAEEKQREGWEEIKEALRAYQNAVNQFWIYLHSSGAPEKLYRQWKAKHRHQATLVSREDAEAEILFLLRDAIAWFSPEKRIPFLFAMAHYIYGDLGDWVTLQTSAVEHIRAERRAGGIPADYSLDTPSAQRKQEHGRLGNVLIDNNTEEDSTIERR